MKVINNFWIYATKANNSCIGINRKDNPKPSLQGFANENESVSGIVGQNRFTFVNLDTVNEAEDDCFTTITNPNNNNHIEEELMNYTDINLNEVDRLDTGIV
jgi:hypothetical protein